MLSTVVPLYAEGSAAAEDPEETTNTNTNTNGTDAAAPLEQLDARTRALQNELEALLRERARLATALAEQAAREKIETLFRGAEQAAEAGDREEAEALRRQALAVQEALLKALYSKSKSPHAPPTSDASNAPSAEKKDATSSATPSPSRESDWERHYWSVEAAEELAPRLPYPLTKDLSTGDSPNELDSGEVAPQPPELDSQASTKRARKAKGRKRRNASERREGRSYSRDEVVRDRAETLEAVLRILTRRVGAPPAHRGPSRPELREMRKVLRQLRAQLDHLDARLDAFERS